MARRSYPVSPNVNMLAPFCRNCEWYDDGTGLKRTAEMGDCLNTWAPRFTTRPDQSCSRFKSDTQFEIESRDRTLYPSMWSPVRIPADNHAAHVEAHQGLLRTLAETKFEVSWHPNPIVHRWRRFWRGPKMVSGAEIFAAEYAYVEANVPDAQKIVKPSE